MSEHLDEGSIYRIGVNQYHTGGKGHVFLVRAKNKEHAFSQVHDLAHQHGIAIRDSKYDGTHPNKQHAFDHTETKAAAKNKRLIHNLKEDAPTNAMGTSSASSGPIVTFDPFLRQGVERRKKLIPFGKFKTIKAGGKKSGDSA